nr:MAG TPA: MerE protein [Caudoviricetes sp.]
MWSSERILPRRRPELNLGGFGLLGACCVCCIRPRES